MSIARRSSVIEASRVRKAACEVSVTFGISPADDRASTLGVKHVEPGMVDMPALQGAIKAASSPARARAVLIAPRPVHAGDARSAEKPRVPSQA